MRALFVLMFLSVPAWGCSCMASPLGIPPCQAAWAFSAVFTGMVAEITDPGFPGLTAPVPVSPMAFPQKKVRFQITEAFLGLDHDQREIVIETGLGGGDCGYPFQRGREYIVYASKASSGVFSAAICSPTRLAADAADDVKYLRGLDRLPPTTEIRVTAYDVHGSWRSPGSGQSRLPVLPGVTITIEGPGIHESSAADAAGRHVFSGLPPGEYKVAGSLEGYTMPSGLPSVRVHSKGCAEVPLPLQLDRTVSGRVLSKDGQPASGVTVEAVPQRPRYENDLPTPADSAQTDAEGRYVLRRLGAGDYYLGVSLSRSPKLEQPYTRWFYPGTEDPAAAAILHVSDRVEAQRMDLTLPEAQRDRVIRGLVYGPDGRVTEKVNIFLEDPRWPWQTSMVAAFTGPDGRFLIHVLDGTRYRLHAATFQNGPISAEPAPIAPGADPLDLKLILTRKGYSPIDTTGKGLESWRKGLGLH